MVTYVNVKERPANKSTMRSGLGVFYCDQKQTSKFKTNPQFSRRSHLFEGFETGCNAAHF